MFPIKMDTNTMKSPEPAAATDGKTTTTTSPTTITVKRAKHLLNVTARRKKTIGDKWFVVDQGWWKTFRDQANKVGGNDDEQQQQLVEMPPLSNAKIVAMDEHENMYKLLPNLSYSDYLMVPERVFNKLRAAYGVEMAVRDVVVRKVLQKHYQPFHMQTRYAPTADGTNSTASKLLIVPVLASGNE